MGAPFRSLPPPLLSSKCHCGYKQMPLRLRLRADATATTSRCHCGYKQMPPRLQADATASYTVNKTTDRPNVRHHSCPTSSHTLYSRSSSPRRMIPSGVHLACCAALSAPACSLCPLSVASILTPKVMQRLMQLPAKKRCPEARIRVRLLIRALSLLLLSRIQPH
jgi:hypothetical protein